MFLRIVLFWPAIVAFLCLPVRGAELDPLFLDMRLDMRDASCTDRCHVNSLSYRNDFEGEVFQHATHSPEGVLLRGDLPLQGKEHDSDPIARPSTKGLHCVDCHEDKEVNREGHGRLIIRKEESHSCHHVDYRNESCARCHRDIDARPMEYQGKPFVHGFAVDSDVDCRECHMADPKSGVREGINCTKCHHTRPRMACLGCHEESLTKVYYPRPVEMNHLGWTTGFLHSQHSEALLSCQECHPPREDRDKGLAEYQTHCGKCHHEKKGSSEGADCQRCHQTIAQFFGGEFLVGGVEPIPDKMSRVLRCADCHKPLEGGMGFSRVGEECVRCHNEHYGKLLEAQRGVILSWLDRLRVGLSETGGQALEFLDFIEHYGLHNFSYSKRILAFLENDFQDIVCHVRSP